MKYLQLASVSTPAAVSTWFQDELVNRGVDAAYTFYVLSLLKEPEDDEQYHYGPSANAKTPHPQAVRPERRRLLAKRCAIECLKSAADSNEEFDALVEELLARLEPTGDTEADRNDGPQPKPDAPAGDNRRRSEVRERLEVDREPKTLAERAKKYFDAFPALQVEERPLLSQWTAKPNGTEAPEDQEQRPPQVVARERKRRKNKRKSPPPALRLSDDLRGLARTDRVRTKDWPTRWARSPEHPKVKADARAEPSKPTGARAAATNEADMGSIVREETLLSRLTQKFDSKLAAIWADVPTVDDQSSLWKISLDLSLGGRPGGRAGCERSCDEVIFSIPNLSIFSKILEDDDDLGSKDAKSQYGGAGADADLASSQIPQPPSPPTICLKNSTLNYDKNKTAFKEVIPTRKLGAATRNLLAADSSGTGANGVPLTQYPPGNDVAGPGAADAAAAAAGTSTSAEGDDEDLLVSPRTHFTPIRAEPEPVNLDDDKRPPSSSLEELASYHLPLPEAPKRHQQLHHATTSTAGTATVKSSKAASGSVSNAPVTAKQQRSIVKQQKLLQQQQLLTGQPAAQGNAEKATESQKQHQQLKQQPQDPPMATNAGAVLTATAAGAGVALSCAVTSIGGANCDADQRDLHTGSQHLQQELPLRQSQPQMSEVETQQTSRSLTTASATAAAAALPIGAVSADCATNAAVMASPHPATKCVAALDDEEVRALWKMVNFTVPQAPTVDGDADVLGVAHCWRSTGPALTATAASDELRDEIRDEEEELFRDIFLEARALQALQASQEAQQQRIAKLHEQRMQQRRQQPQDDGDLAATSGDRADREVVGSSTTGSSVGGYDSASYHDTALEFGQLPGCEDACGTADLNCPLGYSEDACGVPIEYLSHFSSGVTTVTPATSCLFASPETYDSAIVSSVRCIQDLQRRRQRAQRKPCTFYMEGNCRRTDCKFSHELAAITCRFWEEGSCFKGLACPFLHGYASFEEELIGQPAQALSAGAAASNAGSAHGHHRQHGVHLHPSHHHHQHPKKDAIGHVAKRASKFTIGGGGLSVFCCGSSQPSSPCSVANLKGRGLNPSFAVAGTAGLRVFSRRRPVFKRPWPHLKESEQDFPSLGNQKSGSHLRAVAKKNLKKTNSIVPKKAKKKKKKSNSSTSSTESKESKDRNNNSGQSDKEKKKDATPATGTASNANTATKASTAATSTATI